MDEHIIAMYCICDVVPFMTIFIHESDNNISE